MSKSFWLIQRGSFRSNLETATSFLGGGDRHLVSGDYMGAAEFEWGAVPAAYSRVMSQLDKYELFCDDLKTVRGVPVCLFCRKDRYVDTLTAIKDYINTPYPLKEWSGLHQHFEENLSDFDRHVLKTNFWWCIDHDYSPEESDTAGDWMLFVGAADRQAAFLRVINADFSGWWAKMDKDERAKRVKNAWEHH